MEDINMTRKIRTYTEEFKQDSVALALKSKSISQTAVDLGIPQATLHGWVSDATHNFGKQPNKEQRIDLHEELKRLRKENAGLKEDREILKKAATYFAKEIK
jgi:transposase